MAARSKPVVPVPEFGHRVFVRAWGDDEVAGCLFLECQCGWRVDVGDVGVPPAELWRLEQRHLSEVATVRDTGSETPPPDSVNGNG